jgi:DNA polymerase III epsilon subunit-like protein
MNKKVFMELMEQFELAKFYFYNDEIIKSKDAFQSLIKSDEDFAPAYCYLLRIGDKLELYDYAGEMAKKYFLYGPGEFNAGDYEMAISIYDDILLLNPIRLSFIYDYRSTAYEEINEFIKARRDKISFESYKTERERKFYLFIDTETSGLPLNWNAPESDVNNWPRIVQIAWILSDDEGNIVNESDFVIKPDGFIISQESIEIHGISNEKANCEGVKLVEALHRLIDVSTFVDYVVGHNIKFDFSVIASEFIRKNLKNPLMGKSTLCTMESSTNFCAIPGIYGIKWPKLNELYFKLFQDDLVEAHDASIDINATFECFWELKKLKII